jgi:hypothetical protein
LATILNTVAQAVAMVHTESMTPACSHDVPSVRFAATLLTCS